MAASLFVSVQEGPAVRVCRDVVSLRTERAVQFIDITDLVAERVRQSRVWEGTVTVQSLHTTAGLFVNEGEPLLLEDFRNVMERWAPAGAPYRHNELAARVDAPPDERPNGHAHARALFLAVSVCLNVTGGEIELGDWQSLFLVELDGPRRRDVSIQVMGVPGDGDRR